MSNITIQFIMFFFLYFIVHIYYLISILLKKEKQDRKKVESKGWVILGLITMIAVFSIFYFEFLTDKSLSDLSSQNSITNWGYFGSYFGGILAPILTFITLIILIKQVKESQIANELQIEHMNKTRRIEILTENINSLSNQTNKLINKVHPLTEELIQIYMKTDIQLLKSGLTVTKFSNNYEIKISRLTLSDKSLFELEWRSIIAYLTMLNNEHKEDTKEYIDKYIMIESHNISILIKKIIALCCELSSLDDDSYQYIKFTLVDFIPAIEEFRQIDLIEEENYILLQQLVSIHNNENQSIDNNLKRLFSKEISKKYNKNLDKNDLENIKFEIIEDITLFRVEIEDTTYIRVNGEWKKGTELSKQK